jgi:hypothetical protein
MWRKKMANRDIYEMKRPAKITTAITLPEGIKTTGGGMYLETYDTDYCGIPVTVKYHYYPETSETEINDVFYYDGKSIMVLLDKDDIGAIEQMCLDYEVEK